MKKQVIIVGGGAAGLCCAVALSRSDACEVTVLEALDRVGKKLAVTGNGQCNIAHRQATLEAYHGEQPSFARYALTRFGYPEIQAFFDSLQLPVVCREDGKAYPRSLQASSVVDALRFPLEEAGVRVLTGQKVTDFQKDGHGYSVRTETDTFYADKLVMATGGLAAGAKVGSTGDGYRMLRGHGFAVTKLTPSLVQVCTDSPLNRSLKGIKTDCTATLVAGKETRRCETGEVLFTEYGLSGPPILQISRAVERETRACRIVLDLFPDQTAASLKEALVRRKEGMPDRAVERFFTGMLQNRLGTVLLKTAGLTLCEPIGGLSESSLERLATLCKALSFPVVGTTGFLHAQVTAGGLATEAFCETTMEAKTVPGLYAVGELLDIDGDCGGYNLSFAWASALCAAASIMEENT